MKHVKGFWGFSGFHSKEKWAALFIMQTLVNHNLISVSLPASGQGLYNLFTNMMEIFEKLVPIFSVTNMLLKLKIIYVSLDN